MTATLVDHSALEASLTVYEKRKNVLYCGQLDHTRETCFKLNERPRGCSRGRVSGNSSGC